MQPVELHELGVGHAIVVPAPHDVVAAEQAGADFPRHLAMTRSYSSSSGSGDDGRRILQVHQHEVGAERLAELDPVAQPLLEQVERHVVHRGIGAGLPDHQRRRIGHHFCAHARCHLLDILAADAAVDHFDFNAGQRLLEADAELHGIGVGRIGHAVARGRRGAERHDAEVLVARRSPCVRSAASSRF